MLFALLGGPNEVHGRMPVADGEVFASESEWDALAGFCRKHGLRLKRCPRRRTWHRAPTGNPECCQARGWPGEQAPHPRTRERSRGAFRELEVRVMASGNPEILEALEHYRQATVHLYLAPATQAGDQQTELDRAPEAGWSLIP